MPESISGSFYMYTIVYAVYCLDFWYTRLAVTLASLDQI